MITYEEFIADFLVEDGMIANAVNINKAPDQLKKEIVELSIEVDTLNSIVGLGGTEENLGTIIEFLTELE